MQETLDGIAGLRRPAQQGGVQAGGIMINMVRPVVAGARPAARRGERLGVDEHELAVALKAAGLEDSRRLAADLAAELVDGRRTAAPSGAAAGAPGRAPASRVTSCR